jgi:uroporphyrinogen-III synthase
MRYLRRQITHTPSHTRRTARAPDGAYIAAARPVLIVRGQAGRDFLSEALQQQGVEVELLTAYRRLAPELDAQNRLQLLDLLDGGADWVITSSEALRNLKDDVEQVAGNSGWERIQRATVIVPHVRIAETAKNMGFQHVILTASGDEALVTAIQSRP